MRAGEIKIVRLDLNETPYRDPEPQGQGSNSNYFLVSKSEFWQFCSPLGYKDAYILKSLTSMLDGKVPIRVRSSTFKLCYLCSK